MLGLTHLIDAIKAHQQGHREDALRFLAILALQFAAHKQIEALVGTAEFQIGMKSDRVVALHQGVDQFVHGNRKLFGKTLGKVIAFEQSSHRVAAGKLNEARSAQLVAPFGIPAHFGLFDVDDVSSLFEIGFGVDLNLFRRQRRTGRIAAGRIANGGRKVTDQEDHRVADVNVGGRGIQTELAAQLGAGRLGAGQLLLQFAFDQKRVGTAGNRGHCLLDFGRHFVFLFFGTGGFNRHRYGIPKKLFHSTAAIHSQQTERYCTERQRIKLKQLATLA